MFGRVFAMRGPGDEEDLIMQRPDDHMFPIMNVRFDSAFVLFKIVAIHVGAPVMVTASSDVGIAMH